jgi:hypothetical protein
MIKKLMLLSLGLFIGFSLFAQYDFREKGKSVVQVMVTIPGEDPSVCTGFVWKRKDWVVTSLHAMHPKGKIRIKYGDVWNTDISVIRVHEKADLVLLQVGASGKFPASVVPIESAKITSIAYKEELSSIGYNMGARSAQPKSLKRGGIVGNKETLYYTLPPEAVTKLQSFKVPDVNLEIMMIEGSLLPGYSGSPIFHEKDGSLVAIGDGGLDAGTKNVSWAIPAKYLAELETSSSTTIPSGMESSPLHFSSKVAIKDEAIAEKIKTEPEDVNFEQVYEMFAEEYAGVQFGDYEFYYVKTRTYDELYSTSFDTENLDSLMVEFQSYGLSLDYSLFQFDVYEDPYHEVILVVPSGMPLKTDYQGNLYADLTYLPMGHYFSLNYGLDYTNHTDVTSAATGLIKAVNSTEIAMQLGGFTESEEDYYGYQLDDYSSIAWMILLSNNYYQKSVLDAYGNDVLENNMLLLYYTVMFSTYEQPTTFYSMASLSMPENAFSYLQPGYYLDCLNPDNYAANQGACDYFESWMKVVIASHFTSFSYIQYAEGN